MDHSLLGTAVLSVLERIAVLADRALSGVRSLLAGSVEGSAVLQGIRSIAASPLLSHSTLAGLIRKALRALTLPGALLLLAPFLPTIVLAAGAIAAVALAALAPAFRQAASSRRDPVLAAGIVFGLTVLIAAADSADFEGSLRQLAIWAAALSLYALLAFSPSTRGELLGLAGAFVAGSVPVGLLALKEWFFGAAQTDVWVNIQEIPEITRRVVSVFENPNVLAQYLALVLAVGFGVWLALIGWPVRRPAVQPQSRSDLFTRWTFLLLAAGLAAVPLLMTFSRGGWVAAGFALALTGVLVDRRLALLFLGLLILAPFVLPDAIIQRAVSAVTLKDTSSVYRFAIWNAALRMIEDNLWFGIGPGLGPFSRVYQDYLLAGTRALHSHNLYLQMLVETGVLGLATFLWTMVRLVREQLRTLAFLRAAPVPAILATACAAGVLGQLVYGIGDYPWYQPKLLILFWGLAGLSAAARRLAETEARAT